MGTKRRNVRRHRTRGRLVGCSCRSCRAGVESHEIDELEFLEELEQLDQLAFYDPDEPGDHHQELPQCL